MIAHFDLDAIKYAAASVGEDRSVLVTHKASGRTIEVPTRSDFYGRKKSRDGGKLAQINEGRTSPFLWDEFEYEDIQRPQPIANVLHSAKLMTERVVKECGASSVQYYIGKGDSFRVELSTILEYKGQRSAGMRPLLLDEVTEYLATKFKAEIITGYEVDDVVVINSYGKKDHFIVGLDKDYYGSGSKFFNFNKPELGILPTTGLGTLQLGAKGKITGFGRKFKLWQICSNDTSDNYAANCASDIKWAGKSAYDALVGCSNDKELFQAATDVFKHLYPEPKVITGWRGDQIEIDWLYVFQECWNMAHLHRKKDDFVNVKEVLDNLGVKYE